jgi:hypothetical protein
MGIDGIYGNQKEPDRNGKSYETNSGTCHFVQHLFDSGDQHVSTIEINR